MSPFPSVNDVETLSKMGIDGRSQNIKFGGKKEGEGVDCLFVCMFIDFWFRVPVVRDYEMGLENPVDTQHMKLSRSFRRFGIVHQSELARSMGGSADKRCTHSVFQRCF